MLHGLPSVHRRSWVSLPGHVPLPHCEADVTRGSGCCEQDSVTLLGFPPPKGPFLCPPDFGAGRGSTMDTHLAWKSQLVTRG